MKWYKKQMDQLKKTKAESSKSDDVTTNQKTPGHSFDLKKTGASKRNYPSPVAASKLQRPKTDVY